MPIDYETLRLIWWALLGILLIGFAIMDGFDLGVAICLPWMAKTDVERRILINTVGPTWEGNQVWFILGGGAIFAAWPALYSIAFSGFYLAMLLTLLALILRPVGFKYRSKLQSSTWRSVWDYALFVGGLVPALIFGVAMGNVLQGVPFHFDSLLRPFYTGQFIELLNPFALIAGGVSVCMLAMHGASFIQIKTEAPLAQRAQKVLTVMACLTLILFVLAGVWLYQGSIPSYQLAEIMPHDGPSNPLYKTVVMAPMGALKSNSFSMLIPLVGCLCLVAVMLFRKHAKLTFCLSALSMASIISTVGFHLFPFILPSSTHPDHSLMVWDSSSSQLTLFIMLIATIIFLPIVLAYTAWVYRVLSGKITATHIQKHDHSIY